MVRKKTMHFKSKAAYKRWAAYGNIHGVFKKSPGHTPIKIKGKSYRPKHGGRK